MSADEDTELRDLVAQSLESNGVLGKIRAQLRASVFLALDEQESSQGNIPLVNADLKDFIETEEGKLVTALVREYLEFFNLEFTLAVFNPEVGAGEHYEARDDLSRELNIIESAASHKLPLLAEVIKRSSGEKVSRTGRPEMTRTSYKATQDLLPEQLKEAHQKFEEYDTDQSGTIEKDELRHLFRDMFPDFHHNMLDRYVTDEFRAADKDFSNTIDFEEFLDMYRRLFILCKAAVSHDVVDLTASWSSSEGLSSKIPSPRRPKSSSSNKTRVTNTAPVNGSSVGDGKNSRVQPEVVNNHKSIPKPISGAKSASDFSDHTEGDSFFDEPIPKNEMAKSLASDKPKEKKDLKSDKPSSIPKPSSNDGGSHGMSSLAGLPSLTDTHPAPKANDLQKDVKVIDKKLEDLGLDVPEDDDYDDDFESSNVSPIGQTPRSARSDANFKSIEDEIDEEIEEDLSVAEDLLKGDDGELDDLTTDRTVSPTDQSAAFDYAEEV